MRTPYENDLRILAALERGDIRLNMDKGEIVGRATWVIHSGYRAFELRSQGQRLRATVHRTVLLAKLRRPLCLGYDAAHLNHNKLDNRPENLVELSRQENVDANVAAGRHCKGAKHGRAHLTDAQVRTIRELGAEGKLLQREIAKKVGASQSHVSAILQGRYRSEAT